MRLQKQWDTRSKSVADCINDKSTENDISDGGSEEEELHALLGVVDVRDQQILQEDVGADYDGSVERSALSVDVSTICHQGCEAKSGCSAHWDRGFPTKDGERAHANLHVVDLVLVLVDRLVCDGPKKCSDINGHESLESDTAILGEVGPAHEDANVEHQA